MRAGPKSLGSLVALGYVLVCVPLLAATLVSFVTIERLARNGEELVRDSMALSRFQTQLSDALFDLERSVRQYAVIPEPEVLEVLDERISRSRTILDQIARHTVETGHGEIYQELDRALDQFATDWQSALMIGQTLGGAAERVSRLRSLSREMRQRGDAAIDAALTSLRQRSKRARAVSLALVATLLPLTAALAFFITRVTNRPLRRLMEALNRLGRSDFEEPVRIRYPSEMAALARQVDWLRLRLSELERDKDRFLRNVSHELKTPLSSLHEGISLIEDGSLGAINPQQAEVVGILRESTDELEGLIANLIAYAAWRRKREKTAQESFPLQPCVARIAAKRKMLIGSNRLEVRTDFACAEVRGQRLRLEEALDNLFGNAIKHAPEGSAIDIVAKRADGHFEISVRDYGKGINWSQRESIFEPFVRGGEPEEDTVRGTGIGLAIVRETMLAHNGTATVENAGPGARFILRWPDEQNTDAVPAADAGGLRDAAADDGAR